MSRRHLDKPSASVLAAFAANVAAIFILPPPLFVYLVIVDLFAGFIAVVGMYLAADQRAEIAEHRALDERCKRLDAEIRVNELEGYTAVARLYRPGKGTHLRVVDGIPTQRDGSERLPMSTPEWDAIRRETEGL